jgi:hypothetical protein
MNIVIEIDELVLHGFPPGERYRIGEALQGELTRLLGERGLPSMGAADAASDRLDGGSFVIASGMPATAIGAAVAGAVYRTVAGVTGKQGGLG